MTCFTIMTITKTLCASIQHNLRVNSHWPMISEVFYRLQHAVEWVCNWTTSSISRKELKKWVNGLHFVFFTIFQKMVNEREFWVSMQFSPLKLNAGAQQNVFLCSTILVIWAQLRVYLEVLKKSREESEDH